MIKSKKPDFYLSSTEHADFSLKRACWIKGKIISEVANENKEGLWVEIDPPLAGKNGAVGKKISDLIIYAKYQGSSLIPINEHPLYVNIYRIMDTEILKTGKIKNTSSIALWAWAQIVDPS